MLEGAAVMEKMKKHIPLAVLFLLSGIFTAMGVLALRVVLLKPEPLPLLEAGLTVLFLLLGAGLLLAAVKRLLVKPTKKLVKKLLHQNIRRQPQLCLPDHSYSPELTLYRRKRSNIETLFLILIWAAGGFAYTCWQFSFMIFVLVCAGGIAGVLLLHRFQYCPKCGEKIKCLDIKEGGNCGFHIYYCPECKIKSKKEHYSDD